MEKYLQNLIAEGKTDKTLESLREVEKRFENYLRNDIILISARYVTYAKKNRNGIYNEDQANTVLAKINADLLELINQLSGSLPKRHFSSAQERIETFPAHANKPKTTHIPSDSPIQEEPPEDLEIVLREIAVLIHLLKKRNISPQVDGIELFGFGDDYKSLYKFLTKYCVLKSPDDWRRILYWRFNISTDPEKDGVPLSSLPEAQVRSLFSAIFDQRSWKNQLIKQHKDLHVVLIRRGGSRDLTALFNSLPFVKLKILVSATDDGESWYKPARALRATGIPGASKALLDLAQNYNVKEFLGLRIVLHKIIVSHNQETGKEEVRKKLMTPHEAKVRMHWLLNKMENPRSTTFSSIKSDLTEIDSVLQVAMRIPTEIRLKLAIYLKKAADAFEKFNEGNPQEAQLTFQYIPIRTLLLLGIAISLKGKSYQPGEELTAYWQKAIDSMAEILEVKDGSKVLLPTLARQHLVAVREDGLVYFSEAPINFYLTSKPFLGIWLINEAVNDAFIETTKKEVSKRDSTIRLEAVDMRFEKKIQELPGEWRKQIEGTTFRVDSSKARVIADYFNEKSSNQKRILDREQSLSLAEAASTAVKEADIILADSRRLETNVGGTLITPGLGEEIKKSKAVKICLSNIELENPLISKNHLAEMCRYLSGEMRYSSADFSINKYENYFDYLIARYSSIEEKGNLKELVYAIEQPEIDKDSGEYIESQKNKGRVSVLGLDASQNLEYGFRASNLLIESIFSLYELKYAGREDNERHRKPFEFKIGNNGKLISTPFMDFEKWKTENDWEFAELGMFRENEIVKKFIEGFEKSDVEAKGAFVFDVDMTILPHGSGAELTNYPYLAYLFMRLLRVGIKVAIISGNTAEKQMLRIYKAIKKEMSDDITAIKNLTFYVNGGGTKISFDEEGNRYYDAEYYRENSFLIDDIKSAINKGLKEAANKKFGFNGLAWANISKLKKTIQDKNKDLNLLHDSLAESQTDREKWTPIWGSLENMAEKQAFGESMTYPWVEMRDWQKVPKTTPEGEPILKDGKLEYEERAASIAIKPMPPFSITQTDPNTGVEENILFDPRPFIVGKINEYLKRVLPPDEEPYFLGPAGNSTIDFAVGKAKALNNYIKENGLTAQYVYYFGDEVYQYKDTEDSEHKGNDAIITEEIPGVNTMAVNYNKFKIDHFGEVKFQKGNNTTGPLWIGRTPQALLEFLEALLIKPGDLARKKPKEEQTTKTS